jgi:hypothetical protein
MNTVISGTTDIDSFDQIFSGSDLPLSGIFLMPSGSMRFFFAEPPSLGADTDEDWQSAVDAVTFMAYALDRSDWWEEYSLIEGDIFEDIDRMDMEEEALARRAQFHLVKNTPEDEVK